MEKLLNCPFCGGEAELMIAPDNGWVVACQGECEAQTCSWVAPKNATEQWNRRYTPDNRPLALYQLHQMDGELVWVVTKDKCYQRTVTHSDSGMLHLCDSDGWMSTLNEYNHGRLWAAYAEWPEQEKKCD